MIQQHCYTRARKGIFRQSEGYDTVARSPGLDDAFIKDRLHPFCFYHPSKALQSTGASADKFPKALILVHFPEGSMLLGQTVYVEADFTGQRSTFFTHNYVIPAKDKLDVLNDIRNIMFEVEFQTDIDTEFLWEIPSLPMPPVDDEPLAKISKITKIVKASNIKPSDMGFDKTRTLQLVYTLMQAVSGSRKVYVVPPDGDVRDLLGWLYKWLPPSVVQALGFCTYSREPENKKFLHLVFLEKGILRPGDSRVARDFVFDFENGFFLGLPEPNDSPFLQLLWACSEQSGDLRPLYDFVAQFPADGSMKHWDDLTDLFYVYSDSARMLSYDVSMKAHVVSILRKYLQGTLTEGLARELARFAAVVARDETEIIGTRFSDLTMGQVFEEMGFWHGIAPDICLKLLKPARTRIRALLAEAEKPIAVAEEAYRVSKEHKKQIATGLLSAMMDSIGDGLLLRLDFARVKINDLVALPPEFVSRGKKNANPTPYLLLDVLKSIAEFLVQPLSEPINFRNFIGSYPLNDDGKAYVLHMLKRYMRDHITQAQFDNILYLFHPPSRKEAEANGLFKYIHEHGGTRKGAFVVWAIEADVLNMKNPVHSDSVRQFVKDNLKDSGFKETIYSNDVLKGIAREIRFGRFGGMLP